MPNHTEDFKTRNKGGNQAEDLAERWMNKEGLPFARYGFNSIKKNIPKFWLIHPFVRSSPDYVLVFDYLNNDELEQWQPIFPSISFLEVKGCYDSLKLKFTDRKFYIDWKDYMPINIFINPITIDKFIICPFDKISKHIREGNCPSGRFSYDNKEYWDVDINFLLREGFSFEKNF
tara:strand:+ start:58 stop:582 length:525 start_codon:yes stop_codon:yes gene_type:complete